jgi:hypothetical protein
LVVAQQLIRRSGAAKASLWAVALTDAAAVPAGLAYARYLQSLDPISEVEELELVTSELAYTLVGLAQFAALIIAAVFFIRWFHLAHRNLGSLSDQPAVHDSRWAIWGFFVPILNLVRPQQLMREIWSITSGRWQVEPSRVVGLTRPADHVNLWWGLFLATSFLGNAVGRAAWRATTAQETLLTTWATLFADAFDITAVLVALALVRSVTELQRPLLGHAPTGPAA